MKNAALGMYTVNAALCMNDTALRMLKTCLYMHKRRVHHAAAKRTHNIVLCKLAPCTYKTALHVQNTRLHSTAPQHSSLSGQQSRAWMTQAHAFITHPSACTVHRSIGDQFCVLSSTQESEVWEEPWTIIVSGIEIPELLETTSLYCFLKHPVCGCTGVWNPAAFH